MRPSPPWMGQSVSIPYRSGRDRHSHNSTARLSFSVTAAAAVMCPDDAEPRDASSDPDAGGFGGCRDRTLVLPNECLAMVFQSLGSSFGPLIASSPELHLEKIQASDRGLYALSSCVEPEGTNIGLARVAERCRFLRKIHIDGWKNQPDRRQGQNI